MNPVTIEENYYWYGPAYITNPEWESTLYTKSLSDLNVTYLIKEGLVNPSNGMPIVDSKDRVWKPYFCDVTKMYSYSY